MIVAASRIGVVTFSFFFFLSQADTSEMFKYTVDWLREWGCSRAFGLGTYLPIDERYLMIEKKRKLHRDSLSKFPALSGFRPSLVSNHLINRLRLGTWSSPSRTLPSTWPTTPSLTISRLVKTQPPTHHGSQAFPPEKSLQNAFFSTRVFGFLTPPPLSVSLPV